jgi:hypothetical protein
MQIFIPLLFLINKKKSHFDYIYFFCRLKIIKMSHYDQMIKEDKESKFYNFRKHNIIEHTMFKKDGHYFNLPNKNQVHHQKPVDIWVKPTTNYNK